MKSLAIHVAVFLAIATLTGTVSAQAFQVTSPAFQDGGMIPKKYTCDGQDISPPLKLSGVPQGAKSIALIMDDPDAPRRTWIHWVLFNLPPDISELGEKLEAKSRTSVGALHGTNSWGRRKIGYGGPCPPSGTHRYFFKVYALDTMLPLKPGASKKQLLSAMKGHTLAEAQIMGRYKRSR